MDLECKCSKKTPISIKGVDKLKEVLEDLINQIEMGNYKDSLGQDIKMNKAYIDLKDEVLEKHLNSIVIRLKDGTSIKTKSSQTIDKFLNDYLLDEEFIQIGDSIIKVNEILCIQNLECKNTDKHESRQIIDNILKEQKNIMVNMGCY